LVTAIKGVDMTYIKDKGGRPKKWYLPLTTIAVPREYAAALTEIALEWQQSKLSDKS
jgi:hypothetical protein